MRTLLASAGIAAVLLTAPVALAQHSRGAHGGVGNVSFANTCAPAVQEDLMRGVAMLHSFWFGEGERTFRDVLARDPGCAIADWGIASLLMSNPLAGVGPTPKEAERAQAAVAEGRRIGAKSERERDFFEAAASYYQDWAATPEGARQAARAKAYVALAAKYPADDEAQIFSALYIAGTQSQADQSYASYARAAAILEPQYAKYPEHPGIAHYLIHVFDAPPLAAQGLGAARTYAGLAPDAPHALHMPSHIFTRVGAWEESVATNERSFTVAIAGGERGESYHASDYAVYADLQLARDGAARAAMERALKVTMAAPAVVSSYATAAMAARYALERGDWKAATALTPAAGGFAFIDAITWFARGLGAARSGDAAAAEQAAAQLAVLHQKLIDAKNVYWAKEVDIQRHALAGWIAIAAGTTGDGLRLMREAADLEDRNEKHIITPGRVLPARELLGDMLFAAGEPGLALKEYEASQLREPNRFRGYYGAAVAAEAAGDRDKARLYFGKLLALASTADGERPELVRAKAFAAR